MLPIQQTIRFSNESELDDLIILKDNLIYVLIYYFPLKLEGCILVCL